MKNNFKKAMTLAEILIVVIIVTIVAAVFLAMPKKNVSKTDSAKYYVAYDMLSKLMQEQVAKDGIAVITDEDNKFCKEAKDWLHYVSADCTAKQMVLTNGMILKWTETTDTDINGKKFRDVIVDLDGENCKNVNKDCHEFRIKEDGNVYPRGDAETKVDWISFKVYGFDDETGNKNFSNGGVRLTYAEALNKLTKTCKNNCIMEVNQPLK